MTLDMINPGDIVKIKELKNIGTTKRRLLDLGLINGTSVICLFTSPFKDPKAYLIRGTVISIRNEDAKKIVVE